MKEISIEMARKMKFVQDHVAPVVKRLDPNVIDVAYTFDHSAGDEYVCVVHNDYVQKVCVSADNCAQLLVDVMQEVFLS